MNRDEKYKQVFSYVRDGWSFPLACSKAGISYANLTEDKYKNDYLIEARIIHLNRIGKSYNINSFMSKVNDYRSRPTA